MIVTTSTLLKAGRFHNWAALNVLHSDTIVAPITSFGSAAVAVLRLSGPSAFSVASQVFQPWPAEVTPRYALVGRFPWGEKGIALPFAAGSSFTGQAVVELSVHGGRASVEELLDACIRAGARAAIPGEFSLRAFLNGRLDLSQAEAIADIVEAQTARELRLANRNAGGALHTSVTRLREELTGCLAQIEASIDFSEEVGDFNFQNGEALLRSVQRRLTTLLEEGRRAHLSRLGLRVAIVGLPNAGKSSLLNAMLGFERAIVTSVAGTTRDTIEETLIWKGRRLVLTDTAGLRPAIDAVERLGVERTAASIASADQVLYLFDAAAGWSAEDEAKFSELGREATIVGNKSDLARPDRGIPVSCLTANGLELLLDRLVDIATDETDCPTTNDRQATQLNLALNSVSAAVDAVKAEHPVDLVAVLVRDAIDRLAAVLGQGVSENMLDQIFSRFCIGK